MPNGKKCDIPHAISITGHHLIAKNGAGFGFLTRRRTSAQTALRIAFGSLDHAALNFRRGPPALSGHGEIVVTRSAGASRLNGKWSGILVKL